MWLTLYVCIGGREIPSSRGADRLSFRRRPDFLGASRPPFLSFRFLFQSRRAVGHKGSTHGLLAYSSTGVPEREVHVLTVSVCVYDILPPASISAQDVICIHRRRVCLAGYIAGRYSGSFPRTAKTTRVDAWVPQSTYPSVCRLTLGHVVCVDV